VCKMNLQGCQSPLMSCCRKTPPDAYFEALVSRINSFLLSGTVWGLLEISFSVCQTHLGILWSSSKSGPSLLGQSRVGKCRRTFQ